MGNQRLKKNKQKGPMGNQRLKKNKQNAPMGNQHLKNEIKIIFCHGGTAVWPCTTLLNGTLPSGEVNTFDLS